MNKVVETKASRETPPPSDGQVKDQNGSASKPDGAAKENGAESTASRDPLEAIQEQAHPFK